MITNGYFHFKIFSQVKQVKFVLAIQITDMNGVATNFRSAFKAFYDGFEKFSDDHKDILAATSFLVTKVPKNTELSTIINKLSQVNPFRGGDIKSAFDAFKNDVITNKKVFLFKAAELGQTNEHDNHLLQKIDSATTFWSHNIAKIKTSIR